MIFTYAAIFMKIFAYAAIFTEVDMTHAQTL